MVAIAACSSGPDPAAPDAATGPDAATEPDAAPDGEPVLFATANLRCLVDDWDARLPLLAAQFSELAPDAAALQEACRVPGGRDGLAELVDAIETAGGPRYATIRAETHTAWDTYQEGIAILSRVEPSSWRRVDLAPGAFPRAALIADLDTPAGPVVFAATHLSFGDRAAVRRQQLDAVRREAGAGAIIAGDFNETPEGGAVEAALADGFADAWARAHPGDPGPTVPADAPTARIDYILVGEGLDIDDAGRFLDRPSGATWPSDHRGVWTRLRR